MMPGVQQSELQHISKKWRGLPRIIYILHILIVFRVVTEQTVPQVKHLRFNK